MDLKSRSGEPAGAPRSIYGERDLQDLWELLRFRREAPRVTRVRRYLGALCSLKRRVRGLSAFSLAPLSGAC